MRGAFDVIIDSLKLKATKMDSRFTNLDYLGFESRTKDMTLWS